MRYRHKAICSTNPFLHTPLIPLLCHRGILTRAGLTVHWLFPLVLKILFIISWSRELLVD